jgi:hypothetical protein
MAILDDCTHYSWTFSLRQKSDNFLTLFHFFAFVSTQLAAPSKASSAIMDVSLITPPPTLFPLSRHPTLDVVFLHFLAEWQG